MNTKYKPGDIVLGNWTLVRLIGEGNYGSVFEAEREDFGSVYKSAIKIITIPQNQSEIRSIRSQGMDDESLTAYFQGFVEDIVRESALMSRLKGTPNVVSYEDHSVIKHDGEIGWDIIIRMELLTPLYDYSKSESFTRQTIIKLGVDICSALELCQKHNIVHRDIKPENIFVSDLGDFKLGDFGIARTVEKTSGGLSKKGTYTYMAPEVYRDEAYGPSVDIYSLGIVLYRLLNDNRTPFLPEYPKPIKYSDQEAAKTKRFSGAPLPAPKNADGRLAEIVLKACVFDPKLRHSSPMQLRQELEAIAYSSVEAPIIYPKGDATPVKSVDYVDTYAPEYSATASLFGGFHSHTEKQSQNQEGENATETEIHADEATVGLFDDEAVKQTHEPAGAQVREDTYGPPQEFTDEKTPQKGQWQKFVLFAGVGAASLFILLAVVIITLRPETESVLYVENVFGQNWMDARDTLMGQGFFVTRVEEYHDTATIGSVLSQNPAAGTELNFGETVIISVSRGAEPTNTPNPEIQSEVVGELNGEVDVDGEPVDEIEDIAEPEYEIEYPETEPESEGESFISVTNITDTPMDTTAGMPLALSGTVNPSNAANRVITWNIVNAGDTGATISENTLNTVTAGTVTVRATVVNGASATTDFTQDFSITVSAAFVPVAIITGVLPSSTTGTWSLSGTANPSNATNRNIAWSVINDGGTGATINGNALNTTSAGIVTVRATVANGADATTDFMQDFSITVSAAPTPRPRVGEIIQFGGRDWRVLEVQSDRALLLHETVIVNQPYHNTHGAVTWATSSSRAWLNGAFFNSFSAVDRARILETHIVNSDNPWSGTTGGTNTTDRIFILSVEEVVRYFGDSELLELGRNEGNRDGSIDRLHDIWIEWNSARSAYNDAGETSRWWVRTPGGGERGSNSVGAVHVGRGGYINLNGYWAEVLDESSRAGLRPALWLSLEP